MNAILLALIYMVLIGMLAYNTVGLIRHKRWSNCMRDMDRLQDEGKLNPLDCLVLLKDLEPPSSKFSKERDEDFRRKMERMVKNRLNTDGVKR